MKKVFIVHGFEGIPNGAWRGWLMQELEKDDIYACALPMPSPEAPAQQEWIDEISRQAEANKSEELYFVGHSLGGTAILRYLENAPAGIKFSGTIFVSTPIKKTFNRKIDGFFEAPFDFTEINPKAGKAVVIHGDNDPYVTVSEHGDVLAKELHAEYIVVKNGGHLNGSAGWHRLPECLAALKKIISSSRSPTL